MTMTGTPIILTGGVIKLNVSGSLTDYSDQIEEAVLTPRLTVGSYYVLSSRFEKQATGAAPRGFDLRLTVIKTTGASDLAALLQTIMFGSGTDGEMADIAFEAYKPDTSSDSEKYAGNVVLKGADSAQTNRASSGDVERIVYNFSSNGTVTHSIVA